MRRPEFLMLAALASRLFAIEGSRALGRSSAAPASAVPTVNQAMTRKHVMPSTRTRIVFGA